MVKKYRLKSDLLYNKAGRTITADTNTQFFITTGQLLSLGAIEEVDPYHEFIKDVADVARKHGVELKDVGIRVFSLNNNTYSTHRVFDDVSTELKKESSNKEV